MFFIIIAFIECNYCFNEIEKNNLLHLSLRAYSEESHYITKILPPYNRLNDQ